MSTNCLLFFLLEAEFCPRFLYPGGPWDCLTQKNGREAMRFQFLDQGLRHKQLSLPLLDTLSWGLELLKSDYSEACCTGATCRHIEFRVPEGLRLLGKPRLPAIPARLQKSCEWICFRFPDWQIHLLNTPVWVPLVLCDTRNALTEFLTHKMSNWLNQ